MREATTASCWSADHVAKLVDWSAQAMPIIDMRRIARPVPGHDTWDMWPVQLADGTIARFDGWTVWLALAAPCLPDPDKRHDLARIRLLSERGGTWRDCGNLLPDGLNPGSREWAGSAVFDPVSGRLTVFFTAAGRAGEPRPSFIQRLFHASARFACDGGVARAEDWTRAQETVVADSRRYLVADQIYGEPGFIRGFRDPAHFRDPADGADYLLFTASLAEVNSPWNAGVGLARGQGTGWTLLAPLLTAKGLNTELERPHVRCRNGLYYLFWSTQRRTFAPDGPTGPNGLYGAVAPALAGPYVPLNASGLVAANPSQAPLQAYSWWVTADLDVQGFVDLVDVPASGPVDDPQWRRAHFGGRPAPVFRIGLDGDRAWVQH
ncbi:MAG: glycoside hydrolase family 68 protein [Novosphingobium sp.]